MEFTAEIKKATEPIYQKISKAMPEIEWSVHAPYIHKINKLRKNFNLTAYITKLICHDQKSQLQQQLLQSILLFSTFL